VLRKVSYVRVRYVVLMCVTVFVIMPVKSILVLSRTCRFSSVAYIGYYTGMADCCDQGQLQSDPSIALMGCRCKVQIPKLLLSNSRPQLSPRGIWVTGAQSEYATF
jgi:hypothetical protein